MAPAMIKVASDMILYKTPVVDCQQERMVGVHPWRGTRDAPPLGRVNGLVSKTRCESKLRIQ